jgi:antitoxin component of RelBE/YafQ-DinJ toxin-antitoxin module
MELHGILWRSRQVSNLYRDSWYNRSVGRAISVRLDDDAERALRALEAAGLSQSEAVRSALLASARHLRRSKELAAEVATLEADDGDRKEMLAVAELMEALRAKG